MGDSAAAGSPPFFAAVGDFCRWLDLAEGELWWLSDVASIERRRSSRAQNYRYTLTPKVDGSSRLVEAPKPRLRALQRRLLEQILNHVPVHPACHGFVRGRSTKTAATVHVGQAMVVKLDLRDFFASIPAARVHAVFRRIGYGVELARSMTGLCTNATPASAWRRHPLPTSTTTAQEFWRRRRRYATPHLPAGAPTSPALANLVASMLDRRLAKLAESVGAHYTRYADDLTFSGDHVFRRRAPSLFGIICEIAAAEGFMVNAGKTRWQSAGVRQCVTGLVVNERLNAPRDAFDRLKATLFNCIRYGPRSQNQSGVADFQQHLRGRIAWVGETNATREQRLLQLYDRIDWH